MGSTSIRGCEAIYLKLLETLLRKCAYVIRACISMKNVHYTN